MSRPIQQRRDYSAEAVMLGRYIKVVKADRVRSDEWKQKLISHLREALSLMLHDQAARDLRSVGGGKS